MKPYKAHIRWGIASLIMLLIAGGAQLLVSGNGREAMLAFSRVFTGAVRTVTNLLPFSTMELFFVVVAFFLVWAIVSFCRRLCRKEAPLAWLVLCKLTAAACALILLFTLMMGVNYNDIPLTDKLGIKEEQYTAEELYELTAFLAEQCAQTADKLEEADYQRSFSDYAQTVSENYALLKEQYPFLKGVAARPKPVLASTLMCYIGIDGICFPFTAEANVNRLLPTFSLPNVMAHEIAHSYQVAPENEASFVGMLACFSGKDIFTGYSALLSAFIRCGNALYREDAEQYRAAYALLGERAQTDLKTLSDFYRPYQGKLQEVSNKVNDTYLKANGQAAGTKSYGQVVDLLLAFYQSGDLPSLQLFV